MTEELSEALGSPGEESYEGTLSTCLKKKKRKAFSAIIYSSKREACSSPLESNYMLSPCHPAFIPELEIGSFLVFQLRPQFLEVIGLILLCLLKKKKKDDELLKSNDIFL